MSGYRNLKSERPVRFFLAVVVFRALWWPTVALMIPFALIGGFVDWLSWTAFPAIARFFQPIGSAAHSGALRIGNAVLGYRQEPETHD